MRGMFPGFVGAGIMIVHKRIKIRCWGNYMKKITPLLFGGILIFLHSQVMSGPLQLDWTASTTGGATTGWPGANNVNGDPRVQCTAATAIFCQFNTHYPSTTDFRYDIFVVNGVKYAEIKVGNENTDFVQQAVVRVGGVGASPVGLYANGSSPHAILGSLSDTNSSSSNTCTGGSCSRAGSHSGGQPGNTGLSECASIAAGSSSVCVSDAIGGGSSIGNLGLGFDPLGLFVKPLGGHIDVEDSGNGTNNPTTAIVRMIIKDSEFTQEFRKDSFNYKPQITATLTTPDMVSIVSMDMRAIDYNTLNANAPFVNTLTFTNPADAAANFNQATDARDNGVTAGQFVYLPQGGWLSSNLPVGGRKIDFRAGFYLQPDGGGFNVYENDVYGFYRNPAQNGGALTGVPPCGPGTCVLPAFARD